MNWIITGTIAGLLLSGTFETEEACLGRKAMIEKMEKNKVEQLTCHDNRRYVNGISSGSITIAPNILVR